MNDVLSVGVIGAGGIARSHMRAIEQNDNIRLVAVMDVDADRAESAAAEYGGKAYTNLEALLEDAEVEAVHVCTPHSLHADQVVAATAAGKHVLVEKPMALTVVDCDRMIEACDQAGKILMVGQVMRYYPVNRLIRQMIADGEIGEVGHLMRRRYSYFNPTQPGSRYRHWYLDLEVGGICVLYCFGPHEYDILHWYLDSPVQQVYAQGTESTELYEGQKDSYTAVMTHANGAVSVLSQSVVCHASAHDQYIVGSKGSMMLAGQKLLVNGEAVPVNGANGDGMSNQIREFATCCLEGREPDASGRSVRHSMAVIEAAKHSAEWNAPVQISEFE
ncbi:MAG: Gfo/Idh/MocA family oxidoreductase [Candidatus Poribacteria bacterium]|nr:Gfo/Idh/MocA family oxidoreductase [Candidatus Poribacteria bacterium]